MKAMVFAAGIGSRLKELTAHKPKCLMEVGGTTMLERVVERLKAVGVTAVAINVHHHPDQIIDFVRARDFFGIKVEFSREDDLLDTGGGLKKVQSFFDGERAFLIHNSDIHSSIDLRALVAAHLGKSAIGTLAIMSRESSRGLYFDEAMRLTGWTVGKAEPPARSTLRAFCGVSVASSELFASMDERSRFSIIETYLTAARTTERVFGEIVDGSDWTDIGTPEQLRSLQSTFE